MTDTFFDELKNHSNAKIEILNRYYVPWLRKITQGAYNKNKCLVIDGFAGEGIYDDGKIGSPIVLINGAIDLCNQIEDSGKPLPQITLILIEGKKKIFNKLITNILEYYQDASYKDNRVTFESHPTVKVIIFNDTFENVMNEFLEKTNSNLIPSFCFVDPFGFSHTPFNIFKKYLENNKAEILFNFMYEEINRFIRSDSDLKLIETYENLFGVNSLEELKSAITNKSAQIRKENIINYYARQLLEKTKANYVLNFEFKKAGRTKMFLVHSTKSIHGLALMKDVMWKVDETGSFLYDDKKADNQIQFEFFDAFTKEEHIQKLSNIIYQEYKSNDNILLSEVEYFVLEKTIYPLASYFKPAMKKLEKDGLITVFRKTGANKGSFNEKTLYINF